MPCICTDCGYDFIDRHHLKLHLKSDQPCSGLSKILFPCHLCKKVFTRKDNLRDDLRSHINLGMISDKKSLHNNNFWSQAYVVTKFL